MNRHTPSSGPSRSDSPRSDIGAVGTVVVARAENPHVVEQARRLQAATYLRCGYIAREHIVDGVMSRSMDPWVSNSVYYVGRDEAGALLGVVRLILWDSRDKLPALTNGRIWPVHDEYISGVAPAVAEVSALAVDRGAPPNTALALYEAIWEYGIVHGHMMWLMLVEPALRSLLHALLGPITYPIGDPQWYMGGNLVPAALRTCETHGIISAFAVRKGREGLKEAFPHNPAWDKRPDLGPAPDRSDAIVSMRQAVPSSSVQQVKLP